MRTTADVSLFSDLQMDEILIDLLAFEVKRIQRRFRLFYIYQLAVDLQAPALSILKMQVQKFCDGRRKHLCIPLSVAPLAYEDSSQSNGNLGQRGLKGRHIAKTADSQRKVKILPKGMKTRRQGSVWDFTLDFGPTGICGSTTDRTCVEKSAPFNITK